MEVLDVKGPPGVVIRDEAPDLRTAHGTASIGSPPNGSPPPPYKADHAAGRTPPFRVYYYISQTGCANSPVQIEHDRARAPLAVWFPITLHSEVIGKHHAWVSRQRTCSVASGEFLFFTLVWSCYGDSEDVTIL